MKFKDCLKWYIVLPAIIIFLAFIIFLGIFIFGIVLGLWIIETFGIVFGIIYFILFPLVCKWVIGLVFIDGSKMEHVYSINEGESK